MLCGGGDDGPQLFSTKGVLPRKKKDSPVVVNMWVAAAAKGVESILNGFVCGRESGVTNSSNYRAGVKLLCM